MNKTIIIAIFSIFLISSLNNVHAQNDDKLVVFQTKSGNLVIELFPNDAPNTVDNFLKLAESGFYDRTIFHRVIEGFMIQGGDPKTKPGAYEHITDWGTGDAGYTIDAEFNSIKHNRGIVSMARSADPNSASSQFFIVHKDSNFLDGQYAAFGRLATQESYDTLDKIASLEIAGNDIPKRWGDGEILETLVVKRSEIPDLLELGEVERTALSSKLEGNEYSNTELGFSISAPEGWLVQEPVKTNQDVPDVIAVGSTGDKIPPAIYVSVNKAGGASLEKNAENYVNEFKQREKLTVLLEEKTTINQNNAYVIEAKEPFEIKGELINVKFQMVILQNSDNFYSIVYTNDENDFDSKYPVFQESLNSFAFLSTTNNNQAETVDDSNTDNGGGCLIATATFGSELAPQVQFLRELRDNTVMSTSSGTSFMSGFNALYYSFSPSIADLERENPAFKEMVKITITPLLSSLSLLSFADIDSEAEMLGYGIGVILLNIGMYFVAPAVLIYKFRNRK